ncbi:MAG: restriction endonuclease subunit S [Anaerolineales bacterium]
MNAYPEYKETSIEWLGNIPSHWGTVPLKYICYMKGRIGWQGLTHAEFIDKGPYLITGMNFKNGKMNWDECYHISQERYDEAPEIHVQEGDVLITKDGTIGKLLFMDYLPGPTSLNSHLLILRPRNDEFSPKYLYYLLQSDAFLRFVDNVKTGTTFYGITQASMGDFRMLIFDKKEQQAIADFLDRKTAQIDTLIEKKQRQIGLLQEQRTALINHAVTKGLNPDAPMKDSGVEWLGEIPSHWEVQKVKRIVDVIDGDRGKEYPNENDFVDIGIPFLSSKNIIDNRLDLTEVRYISKEKFDKLGRGKLTKGDLVITVRGTIGSVGYFSGNEHETAFINAQMMILRPEEQLTSKYFYYLARSNYWFLQLDYSAYGAAQQQLSNVVLQNLSIALPPLKEQKVIEDFLDQRMAQIENAIQRVYSEITLLQEYRTALISEAVTGKIDVRMAVTVHE